MEKLNIFLEHIYEACSQRGKTLPNMLSEAREMGYTGLECDLWRLDDRELLRTFSGCGMRAEDADSFISVNAVTCVDAWLTTQPVDPLRR